MDLSQFTKLAKVIDIANMENRFTLDAVLFAPFCRVRQLKISPRGAVAQVPVEEGVGNLQASRDGTDAVCIFQTLAPPMESLRGSLDESLTGKRRIMVDGFNRELAEDSLGLGDVLADEFGFAKVTQKASRQQGSRLMRWGLAVAAAEPDSAPMKVVLHGVAFVQENANA